MAYYRDFYQFSSVSFNDPPLNVLMFHFKTTHSFYNHWLQFCQRKKMYILNLIKICTYLIVFFLDSQSRNQNVSTFLQDKFWWKITLKKNNKNQSERITQTHKSCAFFNSGQQLFQKVFKYLENNVAKCMCWDGSDFTVC